jgi:hypothetical protein
MTWEDQCRQEAKELFFSIELSDIAEKMEREEMAATA